jgi:hypothetical protein
VKFGKEAGRRFIPRPILYFLAFDPIIARNLLGTVDGNPANVWVGIKIAAGNTGRK